MEIGEWLPTAPRVETLLPVQDVAVDQPVVIPRGDGGHPPRLELKSADAGDVGGVGPTPLVLLGAQVPVAPEDPSADVG